MSRSRREGPSDGGDSGVSDFFNALACNSLVLEGGGAGGEATQKELHEIAAAEQAELQALLDEEDKEEEGREEEEEEEEGPSEEDLAELAQELGDEGPSKEESAEKGSSKEESAENVRRGFPKFSLQRDTSYRVGVELYIIKARPLVHSAVIALGPRAFGFPYDELFSVTLLSLVKNASKTSKYDSDVNLAEVEPDAEVISSFLDGYLKRGRSTLALTDLVGHCNGRKRLSIGSLTKMARILFDWGKQLRSKSVRDEDSFKILECVDLALKHFFEGNPNLSMLRSLLCNVLTERGAALDPELLKVKWAALRKLEGLTPEALKCFCAYYGVDATNGTVVSVGLPLRVVARGNDFDRVVDSIRGVEAALAAISFTTARVASETVDTEAVARKIAGRKIGGAKKAFILTAADQEAVIRLSTIISDRITSAPSGKVKIVDLRRSLKEQGHIPVDRGDQPIFKAAVEGLVRAGSFEFCDRLGGAVVTNATYLRKIPPKASVAGRKVVC